MPMINKMAAKMSIAILSLFEKEALLRNEGNAVPIRTTDPARSIINILMSQ